MIISKWIISFISYFEESNNLKDIKNLIPFTNSFKSLLDTFHKLGKVGRCHHFKEYTLFNFDCFITWHLGHRCEEKFYLHRKSFWYQKIIVLYRVFGKSKRARTHIKTIKKTASNIDSGITRSTCQRNAEPII